MRASLVATLVLVISIIAPALSSPLGYVFDSLNFAMSSDLFVVLATHLPGVTPAFGQQNIVTLTRPSQTRPSIKHLAKPALFKLLHVNPSTKLASRDVDRCAL
jgi:hypothetical protein